MLQVELGTTSGASIEFVAIHLNIFKCYPDDERMAAAQVRGLMLQRKLEGARAAAETALERFPDSQHVWFTLLNLRLV